MAIQIDPEIANLCRALTPAEKAQLEENLVAEGCRDPLVLWGETLLDGHNRREICHRRGIHFATTQVIGVESREDAINWVIKTQLGRRNLNPEEASYLRGRRYNAEKLTPQERNKLVDASKKSRLEKPDEDGSRRDQPKKTASRLAKEFGVTTNLVVEDGAYAAAVDAIAENVGPDAAREIRSGQAKVTRQAVREIAKKPPAEQAKELEKAKEQRMKRKQNRRPAAAYTKAPKPSPVQEDVDHVRRWLRHGVMLFARNDAAEILRKCAEVNIALDEEDLEINARNIADLRRPHLRLLSLNDDSAA